MLKPIGFGYEYDHCLYCGQGNLELDPKDPDLLRCSMCSQLYVRIKSEEELEQELSEQDENAPDFEDMLHDPEYFDNYYKGKK